MGVDLLERGSWSWRGRDKKDVRACGLYIRVSRPRVSEQVFPDKALDILGGSDTIYVRVR